MKTGRIRKQSGRLRCKTLIITLIVALISFASVAEAVYDLPAGRKITWQGNVGVSGDIPNRTTICSTLSPAGGDDTSSIQSAINNCPLGQVVKLNAGTFKISSMISLKSGITLRGAGIGTTILKGTIAASKLIEIVTNGYSYNLSDQPSYDLTGVISKGTYTINTTTNHDWSAGDIIVIDQLENITGDPPINHTGVDGACNWCGRPLTGTNIRPIGQMVKITSVPTTTSAVLEIPLYWNVDAIKTPQAVKVSHITSNAGIEDITFDNSISASDGIIQMTMASNCWLLRVEAIGAMRNALRIYGAYHSTVRGCNFHEGNPVGSTSGIPYGASRGYAIEIEPWGSANLFEDNIIYHMSLAFVLNGATSGNVMAYNCIDNLYHGNFNTAGAAIAFHGAHSMMNLIEGNYSLGKFSADWSWGSSSDNTYFRNRVMNETGYYNANMTIDLYYNQQYYNVIGNVLGTTGVETVYEQTGDRSIYDKAIYALGYTTSGDSSASGNDAQVPATLLRHGNWDSVTNGVVWNGSDDHILPNSLYLSSKPSWWGNLPWPAIGPDLSPMYSTIPAKSRYDKRLTPPPAVKFQ